MSPPANPDAQAAPPHLPRSLASHNAPRCPRCSVAMRLLVPGEHEDQVIYRCDKCGAEVIRVVVRRAAGDE
jgi:tRNA(Ile2) C34 agmatinyltransferase TiaS